MICKFKLLLGLLAISGVLLAASQLHVHETGLHDIDHACISCDLKDLVSHGAVPVSLFFLNAQQTEGEKTAYTEYYHTVSCSFGSIRAPPLHT